MRSRIVLVLSFLPALLQAQAPFRFTNGQCNWAGVGNAVWGLTVRGYSSQWDDAGWSARQALGRPDVWPRYGDLFGAWAPRSSSSPTDWIEVLFPAPVQANELWVFETNGAGAVYAVSAINPDSSVMPLAVSAPVRLERAAHLIAVPVEPARVVIGVRVAVSSAAANTWGEVDAVGASPIRVCSAGRPFDEAAAAIRLPPAGAGDSTRAGVVWAQEVVERSSEDNGRDRAAAQALGAPNVFPRHVEGSGVWAPDHDDSVLEHLMLRFPPTATREILVYETYGVGGVWMVQDLSSGVPVALWADGPTAVAGSEARVLRIVLPKTRTVSVLRIVTSPRAVHARTAIDAVGLVPAGAGGEAPAKP